LCQLTFISTDIMAPAAHDCSAGSAFTLVSTSALTTPATRLERLSEPPLTEASIASMLRLDAGREAIAV
jgi:hypothetical protein